jgi:hypothetical protein
MDTLDDAGRTVMGLLQHAATAAKEDCGRELGVAHLLSLQLREAEDRIRELKAEVDHVREQAVRAENWLRRISKEIEDRFSQQNPRSTRASDKRDGFAGHCLQVPSGCRTERFDPIDAICDRVT